MRHLLQHLFAAVDLVGFVDEDDDAVLVQPSQHSEQVEVGRRQRLLRRQHHDAKIGAFQILPRDLVADEEGVVHAGGVDQDRRETECAKIEIEVGGLGDVGILALGARGLGSGFVRHARRYVTVQKARHDRRVSVAGAEQILVARTQPVFRALLHDLNLGAKRVPVEIGQDALGQLAGAASVRKPLPLGAVEEGERRARLRLARHTEMQLGDDRGPGIDVGRQEARLLEQDVDERAFSRLDLADDGNAADKLFEVLCQRFERFGSTSVRHADDLRSQTGGAIFGVGELRSHAQSLRERRTAGTRWLRFGPGTVLSAAFAKHVLHDDA